MIGKLAPWQRILLLFFLFVIAGPFLPVAVASFAFRWGWPDLLPSIWWWERRDAAPFPLGWDYIFDPVSRVVPALGNTLLIAGLVTLIALALSIPAARTLARHRFRGRSGIELFLTFPLIVPEIAVGIGMLFIFISLGLYGSLWAVVLAHLVPVLPYMIRVLIPVYRELDAGLLEQAALLGAGRRQTFFHVELPLIAPGALAAALFSVVISTNIFLLTFYMGRGQIDTLATLLFSKVSGGGALDPVAAGLTLIICIPGFLFLALSHRIIRENVFSDGIDNS
ncbi:ABC transporter permease [Sneathiella chinensis]|uniref:ABC transporter permease n=1 Tax=Sneathiella chinensis TaxID=349750 RepID=A0ABQ5U5Z2_9PROT|nr:ABC transporter permease subunit [Sneathiella chinensis]GLQ06648.1 ABC transporter permease [Sneathiella chinensis]